MEEKVFYLIPVSNRFSFETDLFALPISILISSHSANFLSRRISHFLILIIQSTRDSRTIGLKKGQQSIRVKYDE